MGVLSKPPTCQQFKYTVKIFAKFIRQPQTQFYATQKTNLSRILDNVQGCTAFPSVLGSIPSFLQESETVQASEEGV